MLQSMTTSVQLTIPFEALAQSVTNLSTEEKYRLFQQLEQELDEEDAWAAHDPVALAEIEEARAAYARGDYITLPEFIATLDNGNE